MKAQKVNPQFRFDYSMSGWTLISDVAAEVDITIPNSLALIKIEAPIKGESRVVVDNRYRLLGQKEAEFLFEHQEKIPCEWQQYRLPFIGTIWRGLFDMHSPLLRYFEGKWVFDCIAVRIDGNTIYIRTFDDDLQLLRFRE